MAQIDQIEVTQADRDAAHPIAVKVLTGELTESALYEAFARYRIASEEAAVLRGVKLGLEAAAEYVADRFSDAVQTDTENGVRCLNERAARDYLKDAPATLAAIRETQDAILALDPQAIAKDATDAQ